MDQLDLVYGHSKRGLFDLPLYKENRKESEKVVVIGENLACHFSTDVIKVAIEEIIYITPLSKCNAPYATSRRVFLYTYEEKWRSIL